MTQLMNSGASWSGRERHCGFVNLHDGTFADASAALGIDFHDDGTAVATVAWDHAGDLDLWFKNRSGPQLRFMRNNGAAGQHHVAFKLEGTTCNRDAVGATVELHAGGKRHRRTVTAGDGYLSQSSKWLHFGLGQADRVDRLVVHWPASKSQTLGAVSVDRGYHIKQGGARTAQPARAVTLAPAPTEIPDATAVARVVLRAPLPLPPTITNVAAAARGANPPAPARAKVISLWAQWCAPCVTELIDFATHHGELRSAGLEVIALSIDKPEDHEKALRLFGSKIEPRLAEPGLSVTVADDPTRAAIEAILKHVLDKPGDISLPTNLLIDPSGQLQVIYLGPVTADRLRADAAEYCHQRARGSIRGSFTGRWYYGMRRDFKTLARDLLDRKLPEDARFYALIHRQQSQRR